eukprot:356890-Chlamydomonas_euryale.AAC.3
MVLTGDAITSAFLLQGYQGKPKKSRPPPPPLDPPPCARRNPKMQAALRSAFEKLDANGNGQVSAAEVKAFMWGMGHTAKAAHVA